MSKYSSSARSDFIDKAQDFLKLINFDAKPKDGQELIRKDDLMRIIIFLDLALESNFY